MTWLKTIALALNLIMSLVSFLRERQLISAGEAKAVNEALEIANERIADGRKARERAYHSDPDPDDPYLRD